MSFLEWARNLFGAQQLQPAPSKPTLDLGKLLSLGFFKYVPPDDLDQVLRDTTARDDAFAGDTLRRYHADAENCGTLLKGVIESFGRIPTDSIFRWRCRRSQEYFLPRVSTIFGSARIAGATSRVSVEGLPLVSSGFYTTTPSCAKPGAMTSAHVRS